MALSSQSMFTYGIEVTPQNRNLDFTIVNGGQIWEAVLNLGYYSLDQLATEIVRAMQVANDTQNYFVVSSRIPTGNRYTISSNSSYFSLNFVSGPNSASSIYSLIGFQLLDYTGSTSYVANFSTGTILKSALIGYNYISPDANEEVQGSRSVSASGIKEAIVFSVMEFIQVEFKLEPKRKIDLEWRPFFRWAIQQRPFDFTPEIANPTTYYPSTLEKSARGSNGMGYKMSEMLPQFPNFYTTGPIEMRRTVLPSAFIL